jgi:hypothetical protein
MARIRENLSWRLAASVGIVLLVLALSSAAALRATPVQSEFAAHLQTELQAPIVNRSGKGDRLDVKGSGIKTSFACEPPFSSLLKLPPPNGLARCLT